MKILQIKNLSKKYLTLDGDVIALDSLSLDIDAGDFVALVGSSGAGKSTLLNMICGLDNPDNGSVLFEGKDIVKLSGRERAMLRRRKIGFIYQFYNLIPELNIKENITLPTELDGKDIDERRLNQILTSVGLAGRGNAIPDTLSGGQKQRVAIARAIFNRPSLILADEPTGNLDSENAEEVIRLLKKLNEEENATILIVTHSLTVAKEAKRIIALANGKIIGDERR